MLNENLWLCLENVEETCQRITKFTHFSMEILKEMVKLLVKAIGSLLCKDGSPISENVHNIFRNSFMLNSANMEFK